jgi:hypothetical protein
MLLAGLHFIFIWFFYFQEMAEAVRFELTEGYQPSTVFKTVALNRSATLPFLEAEIIMKFAGFAKRNLQANI